MSWPDLLISNNSSPWAMYSSPASKRSSIERSSDINPNSLTSHQFQLTTCACSHHLLATHEQNRAPTRRSLHHLGHKRGERSHTEQAAAHQRATGRQRRARSGPTGAATAATTQSGGL